MGGLDDILNASKVAKSGVTIPLENDTAEWVAPVKEYGKDLNEWSAMLHLKY
ncbi:predicted hydrolase [Paenibacillus popilliae ATCC 14706]|uniref:Predicted hydrolase n=1 Tax=Paenibacillus popilliae ATCC 14706 TaxID=1212764 RepID=M9LPW1_PAEPP|nr:predicted hydrolase [Paenibacillus popilliae ATCC 14706]